MICQKCGRDEQYPGIYPKCLCGHRLSTADDPSGLVILDDGQHRITIHANGNYVTLTDQRGEDIQQTTFVPGEMDRIATWWRLYRAMKATRGVPHDAA